MNYNIIFLFVLYAFAVGCSQSKTPVKLEVSQSFASVGQFDGGLMIYGESGTKKIAVSIENGLARTIKLEPAVWTFHTIGWTGPGKFTGSKQCGLTTVDTTSKNTVEISTSSTLCSDASFKTLVGLQQTRFVSCMTFHKYNSANNTWQALSDADSDGTCEDVPLSFKPTLKAYRIIGLDMMNSIALPGITSECYSSNGSDVFELPTNKFPFSIRSYRSTAECLAQAKFNPFRFENGLIQGNQSEFDHLVQTVGSSTRIILPSSITKRGKSPFINMMPSILCGSSSATADCIPQYSDSTHINVPWTNGTENRQLLAKAALPGTCTANRPLSDDLYFDLEECKEERGVLTGKVVRNQMACHATSDFNNVKDLYHVNGYTLVLKSSPYRFEIYNSKGRYLTQQGLGSGPFYHISGISSGGTNISIYALDYNNQVYKYSVDTNNITNITSNGLQSFFDVTYGALLDIDAVSDDEIVFLTSTHVAVRNWSNPTVLSSQNVSGFNKLIARDSRIYLLGSSNIHLHSYNSSSKIISTATHTDFVTPSALNLTYNQAKNLLYLSYSDGTIQARKADDLSASGPFFDTGIVSPGSITSHNDSILVADYTYLETISHKFSYFLITQRNTPGQCTSSPTIAGQSINIKTMQENVHYDLYRDAIDLIGKRNFINNEEATYLFPRLYNDGSPSSGGLLRKAQENLSSGISSILGTKWNTCTDIKNAVAFVPSSFNSSFFDPFEMGLVEVSVQVEKGTDNIPQWICNPLVPNDGSCLDKYDLKISYSMSQDSIFREKTVFKVVCDKKTGEYESFEQEGALDWSRFALAYTTESFNQGRFEAYEYDREPSGDFSGEIAKVYKTVANEFSSRSIRVQVQDTEARASSTEVERKGSNIYSYKHHQQGTNWGDLYFNLGGDGSLTNFNGVTANSCIPTSSSTIYTPHQAGCTLSESHASTETSSPQLFLSFDALSDINSFGTSDLRNAFKIIP